MIRDCTHHQDHRNKLREHDRELVLPELLGTPKGVAALANFLRDTGAFTFTGVKYTPKELSSFLDEPEPPDIDSEDEDEDAKP